MPRRRTIDGPQIRSKIHRQRLPRLHRSENQSHLQLKPRLKMATAPKTFTIHGLRTREIWIHHLNPRLPAKLSNSLHVLLSTLLSMIHPLLEITSRQQSRLRRNQRRRKRSAINPSPPFSPPHLRSPQSRLLQPSALATTVKTRPQTNFIPPSHTSPSTRPPALHGNSLKPVNPISSNTFSTSHASHLRTTTH